MNQRILIESVTLAGFRAYLTKQTVTFSRAGTLQNLAIYAANAKGKSSLVDAFEFYLSKDATLSRLGIKAMQRNAGREALEHVDANAKGVSSEVGFSFREGKETFGEARKVSADGSELTPSAVRISGLCRIPFVIRGYELRRFAEDLTPEQRYEEVVQWFALQPLLVVQKNLRVLRRQLKQAAESNSQHEVRLRDLSRITSGSQSSWDEKQILDWLNLGVLQKVDNLLLLGGLSKADARYQELLKRKEAEEQNLGIAALQALVDAIQSNHLEPGEDNVDGGLIAQFAHAVAKFNAASTTEQAERAKASQSLFSEVWEAAKPLFEDDRLTLEECPVCESDLSQTPSGSRKGVSLRLDAKLTELKGYRKAVEAVDAARREASRRHGALSLGLKHELKLLEESGYAHLCTATVSYREQIEKWKVGDLPPDSKAADAEGSVLSKRFVKERDSIRSEKGDNTYGQALRVANELIALKDDVDRIARLKSELHGLNVELQKQSDIVNKAIAKHIQGIISNLTGTINTFYQSIQGGEGNSPQIHLDTPVEGDTNQLRLQLLVDFAPNRKGVVPTGYLSDSQLHALALSVRLAAITMLNARVPVIVLDDVVTSYDADHRKNIASTIGTHLAGFQVLLVTHDERFFKILQDHLPRGQWLFRRIHELRPDFGPAFHDHRTTDAEVLDKLNRGESAANEIRQAEEEWLLDVCRDFGTQVVIRQLEHPYKYERSELASSLASYLNGLRKSGITVPVVPGISNSFLVSLQKGDVENFGSHFSDNPDESGSIGDERARWAEFTFFRDQFVCSCGSKRFIRPIPLEVPVCKKCQKPFRLGQVCAPGTDMRASSSPPIVN